MPGHGEKLSRKQDEAIAALLAAPTVTAAAAMVGVNVTTLKRWMRQPAFAEAYRQTRREAVSLATGQLSLACGEAVATLRGIVQDTSAPASARVTAARSILDFAHQGQELDEVIARVDALEAYMEQESLTCASRLPVGRQLHG